MNEHSHRRNLPKRDVSVMIDIKGKSDFSLGRFLFVATGIEKQWFPSVIGLHSMDNRVIHVRRLERSSGLEDKIQNTGVRQAEKAVISSNQTLALYATIS